MLSLLTAWCLLGCVSAASGAALVVLAGWPASLKLSEDKLLAITWLGLLANGSVLLALAVWMPLQPWLLLAPLLLLAAQPVRKVLAECRVERATLLTTLIIALGLAPLESNASRLYDSALYHTQLTSWMSTYGLPPGLGLLHYRFGFSSSWLALAAPFDHGTLASRMANVVTGFAILLLLTQWVFTLHRAGSGKATTADRYNLAAIPILLAFSTIQSFSQSPSPNFGAAAASVVVGWLLLEGASPLALLLAAGAFAIKLSAAPAIAASLGKVRIAVLAAAAALAIPLAIANFQTTGCPAFPSALYCTDKATSVEPAIANRAALEAVNQGRNAGTNYTAPYRDMSWIRPWITQGLNPFALFLTLVPLAILAITRTWNRAATLATASAIYAFVTAPDIRFSFSVPAILCGCAGVVILPKLRLIRLSTVAWAVLGACALCANEAAWEVWRGNQEGVTTSVAERWSNRWLIPDAAVFHGASSRSASQNGIDYRMPPESDRCGAVAIPCTPYPLSPQTGFCDKGAGWKGGLCRR